MSLAGQPNRTMLNAGIPLAIGSDAEGPGINPFLNIMLISKSAEDPSPVKLTRDEALAAYTRASAYAELEELEKGTIEAGKLADIAVLSQDILNGPLGRLAQKAICPNHRGRQDRIPSLELAVPQLLEHGSRSIYHPEAGHPAGWSPPPRYRGIQATVRYRSGRLPLLESAVCKRRPTRS